VQWSVDVESIECPRSLVSSESLHVIKRYYAAQRVQKATGAVLGGSDASEWDARWFDAVNLIAAEIEQADHAAEVARADYIRRGGK
jgi:hypothetical protein